MKTGRGIVGAIASVALGLSLAAKAQSPSADALIHKLVQKGILTEQEARELVAEAGTNQTSAARTSIAPWVKSMKLGGELRGRFDGSFQDKSNKGAGTATEDREQFRYRLRYGVTMDLVDQFEVGLRLGSGQIGSAAPSLGGSPLSGNTTEGNDASRKFIFVDAAYAKWKPSDRFSAEFGKMNDAFWATDMIFDPDYTPEGMQQKLTLPLSEGHKINLTAGQWVIFENFNATTNNESFSTNNAAISPNRDVYLFLGQADWAAKWSDHLSTRLAVSSYAFLNQRDISPTLETFINQAGTSAAGSNAPNFNPIIVRGETTYLLESAPFFRGPFPLTLGAEYVYNPGASHLGSGAEGYNLGFVLGDSAKKHNWRISYNYKRIGTAATWHGLNDDDFGVNAKGGTGVQGHQVIASYHLLEPLFVNFRFMRTEQINQPPTVSSQQVRVLFDLLVNF
jgi:hypothetical protein